MSRSAHPRVLEEFKTIPEFPNYEVSSLGYIYNVRTGRRMRTSINNFGHVKISLTSEYDGQRYTRSVAKLVAEAFVRRPALLCDQVVVLDGNLSNLVSTNLVWRPESFAWRYAHQLKTPQPLYYKNLHVYNVITGDIYDNIIEAGVTTGLLFDDIWRSTYTAESLYPLGFVFQIMQ